MKSWRSWTSWLRPKAQPPAGIESNDPARERWTLRFRLALTVIIALTPVAIVSVVQGLDRVQRDVEDVRDRLIQSARASAGDEQNVLASAEQILRALANQPDVRNSGPGCNAELADALKALSYFTNIVRLDAKGTVVCSALPPAAPSAASQPFWPETTRSPGFFISQRVISTRTKRPALATVLPFRDAKGAFDGALLMGLDTQWLDNMLRVKRLPEGGLVALFDKNGTLIAANDQAIAAVVFRRGVKPGAINRSLIPAKGPNSEGWSFALAPLVGDDVFIAFAMRDFDLFSWTYIHVATDLLLPVLMLALASMAIWIATDRQVTRWIGYLRRMAMAYARGHYNIRPAALDDAPAEFRQLGETFSTMADAVQDRDKRLRDAVATKTMLIKETHHRVKNNLQIVMSLLSLQASQLKDPVAREALRQAQVRVNALALVHRILHEIEDQASVDLKHLLHDLTVQIHEGFGGDRRDVKLEFDLIPREAPSDTAVPLTLFTVEALTNVFKHAYPPGQPGGALRIALAESKPGELSLSIGDEGVGVPEADAQGGIGSRLSRAFASQVNGTVAIGPSANGGTVVTLTFPDPQARAPRKQPQPAIA